MSADRECPHCGAKMVEYKHTLSKGLVRAFTKVVLHAAPGMKFSIADVDLSYSERGNLPKLKHWGLIKKADVNKDKGGDWLITNLGLNFAAGRVALEKTVWTYRDHVKRFEGEHVYISDIITGWKYRPQYAREAQPHEPQLELLPVPGFQR